MTRDLVLCIDDDGDRYERFVPLCREREWLPLITDEPAAAGLYLREYGDRIVGVCLDHDMRERNGVWFARSLLAERSFPVAIVSANVVGAENIARVLTDYGVMWLKAPASHDSTAPRGRWEAQAAAFFEGHWDG
jgi:hypothetical protein